MDPLGSVYQKRDGTGAAAILPTSKTQAVDEYLDYAEKERARQAKVEKPENLPDVTIGDNAILDKVWINHVPAISDELNKILQFQTDRKVLQSQGKINNQQAMQLWQQEKMMQADWREKALASARFSSQVTPMYTDYSKNSEQYPNETGKYFAQNMQTTHPDQLQWDASTVQQLKNIDFRKDYKFSGDEIKTTSMPSTDKDGNPIQKTVRYVPATTTQIKAEQMAADKTPAGQARRNAFIQENPNGTDQQYLDWIKKDLKNGQENDQLVLGYAERPRAQGQSSSVNGSKVTIGKNVWQYFADDKGNETINVQQPGTAQENLVKDFVIKDDKGKDQVVSGIFKGYKRDNGEDQYKLIVDIPKHKEKVGRREVDVPAKREFVDYTPENVQTAEGEYGANPYKVREMIGLDEVPKSATQGKTTINATGGGGTTKSISKKYYSKGSDKTKIVYSDGSEEIVDGKQ